MPTSMSAPGIPRIEVQYPLHYTTRVTYDENLLSKVQHNRLPVVACAKTPIYIAIPDIAGSLSSEKVR
jgi:hypothetical protein